MRIRSLFTKIFLWFWLAETIVIATLALVVWIYPYERHFPWPAFDQIVNMHLRGALAERELKGNEAFKEFLRDLKTATSMQTYWLDEAGHELNGEVIPPELQKFVHEHEAELARAEPPDAGRIPRPIISTLSDSKGQRYKVISEPSGFESHFRQSLDPRVLALRVLAVILAAGLGCYALARYLTGPLQRLQETARRLASGDMEARAGDALARRRDEIGRLAEDFDRMATRLAALLTTQKRLLQDVSHELRSPLARLALALELASRSAGPEAAPHLDRIARESERLNELIARVLMLARMDSGAGAFATTAFDLSAVCREIATDADFEACAHNRHVRITASEPLMVVGAPELIRSAVENVVRNAIRYTAKESDVQMSLTRDSHSGTPCAKVSVCDHGPGIPENKLSDVFRPFYRITDARERQTGGTGLGLAIAHRAMALHHGTIRAANAPDGGLIVEMTLPLADVTDRPAAP